MYRTGIAPNQPVARPVPRPCGRAHTPKYPCKYTPRRVGQAEGTLSLPTQCGLTGISSSEPVKPILGVAGLVGMHPVRKLKLSQPPEPSEEDRMAPPNYASDWPRWRGRTVPVPAFGHSPAPPPTSPLLSDIENIEENGCWTGDPGKPGGEGNSQRHRTRPSSGNCPQDLQRGSNQTGNFSLARRTPQEIVLAVNKVSMKKGAVISGPEAPKRRHNRLLFRVITASRDWHSTNNGWIKRDVRTAGRGKQENLLRSC